MRVRRKGSTILAVVAVAFAALAVFAVVGFLALRRERPATTGWRDPMALVVPEHVVPQLALYSLAGASEIETVDAGIDNGEFATAYASLVYSQELADTQRIGRLVALGDKLVDVDEMALASSVFQQVLDLAVLSPEINDPQRADALWRAARGWAKAQLKENALDALEQAQLVATGSPNLQAAQRRSVLVLLETTYLDLGEEKLAEEARSLVSALDQAAGGGLPRSRAKAADLPSSGQPLSSPEVGALEETRRQAAYAVITALSQGETPPADLIEALAEALKSEDVAKLNLYHQELGATSQAGRRSEVHQLLVRWLLLKSRVARKGFGLSIVPDWENQASDITAELSKAYEDLAFDYEDWSASLPDAQQTAPTSYAALRSTILSGRLGMYPNFPPEQLTQKLDAGVQRLLSAGYVDDLFLTAPEENGLQFRLSRSSDLGFAP